MTTQAAEIRNMKQTANGRRLVHYANPELYEQLRI